MLSVEDTSDPLEKARRHAAGIDRDGFGRSTVGKGTKPTAVRNLVYFILAEEVGRVKIGYSSDLRTRLPQLQGLSPVELRVIRVIKGNASMENRIQAQFAEERLHGEWFVFSDRIREFVLDLPAEQW